MNILAASLIAATFWGFVVAYYELFLRRRPLALPATPGSTSSPAAPEPEPPSEPAAATPIAIINSKGKTYYPHARQVTLNHGVSSVIYYFAKEAGEGVLTELPAGYRVDESKNGLPILRKAGGGME